MDNFFSFKGKLTDVKPHRLIPSGVKLQDFVIAVETKPFWKDRRFVYVKLTCYEENLKVLEKMKTGDLLKVKGFIDQNGKDLRFLVTEIKKEDKDVRIER